MTPNQGDHMGECDFTLYNMFLDVHVLVMLEHSCPKMSFILPY